MKNSCYQCLERCYLCHSTCTKYKAYTEEIQAKKDNKLDEYEKYKLGKVIAKNEFRIKAKRLSLGNANRYANC